MKTITLITIWGALIALFFFLLGIFLLVYSVHKAEKENKKQQPPLEESKKKEEEITEPGNPPYSVFVNGFGKLYYEDPQTTCLVNGLEDFFAIHPELKDENILFLDEDPESQSLVFTGPFIKS
jgi:hypothetical protein